jgi:hypothetical protein
MIIFDTEGRPKDEVDLLNDYNVHVGDWEGAARFATSLVQNRWREGCKTELDVIKALWPYIKIGRESMKLNLDRQQSLDWIREKLRGNGE